MTNRAKARYPWFIDSTIELLRNKVDAWAKGEKDRPPELVQQGYKGYNFIRYKQKFFAVARAEGKLHVADVQKKAKYPWFTGDSVEALKSQVDHLVAPEEMKRPPELVEQDYKGYNFIRFRRTFFAVSCAEGDFNLADVATKAKYPWFTADTIETLRAKVDAFVAPVEMKNPPKLIQHDYKGYNIVFFQLKYFALSLAESNLDVKEVRTKAKYAWFSENTIDGLKSKVNAFIERNEVNRPPELVHEDYRGFNVVRFRGKFYALSRAEGALDIADIKTKAKHQWFVQDTLEDAKVAVDVWLDPKLSQKPRLIVENYKGYNVIEFKKAFYAINKNEGSLNVANIEAESRMHWFRESDLATLKLRVDKYTARRKFVEAGR